MWCRKKRRHFISGNLNFISILTTDHQHHLQWHFQVVFTDTRWVIEIGRLTRLAAVVDDVGAFDELVFLWVIRLCFVVRLFCFELLHSFELLLLFSASLLLLISLLSSFASAAFCMYALLKNYSSASLNLLMHSKTKLLCEMPLSILIYICRLGVNFVSFILPEILYIF